MSKSQSCPLCGATIDGASAKACPKCGGRLVQEEPKLAGGEAKGRIGDYFIECHIGSGGMGEVYLARQISMRREVALKILLKELSSDKKYLERFFREVRLLAQIEHPNVVRAIEAGMDGDICYFSMDYAPGKDLKRQIDLGRRFEEPETLRIACEIASALKYAWDKHRLIHRDVKPANVILTPEGEVKLMDLGISRRISDKNDATMDGMMVGSPTYISPEQARAAKDIDFRADMYSLGASLFHMLAGEPPYEADTPLAVVSMHIGAPVPDIRERRPDISKATALLIMRMMEKDKEKRFPSWDEAIAAMESIIERRTRKNGSATMQAEKTAITPKINLPLPKISSKASKILEACAPLQEKTEEAMKTCAAFVRPEALWRQPLHRRIALVALLIIVLMVFSAVVRRSLDEAAQKRERAAFQSLAAALPDCPPENRPALIGRFEQVERSSSLPELRKNAVEAIETLKRQIMDEEAQAGAKRRAELLKTASAKSYALEADGKFDEAIKVWRELRKKPELRDDPEASRKINDALKTLTRSKQLKEAGLDE